MHVPSPFQGFSGDVGDVTMRSRSGHLSLKPFPLSDGIPAFMTRHPRAQRLFAGRPFIPKSFMLAASSSTCMSRTKASWPKRRCTRLAVYTRSNARPGI